MNRKYKNLEDYFYTFFFFFGRTFKNKNISAAIHCYRSGVLMLTSVTQIIKWNNEELFNYIPSSTIKTNCNGFLTVLTMMTTHLFRKKSARNTFKLLEKILRQMKFVLKVI